MAGGSASGPLIAAIATCLHRTCFLLNASVVGHSPTDAWIGR